MKLFKFIQQSGQDMTVLLEGQVFEGYTSATWTERYRPAGEFILEAPLSSGLRELLPTGTLIGNAESLEVMIVENHQISEKYKEDPNLKITGRSFETFLENRIVGLSQLIQQGSSGDITYNLPADYIWNQCVKLINDQIGPSIYWTAMTLTNVLAVNKVPAGTTGDQMLRKQTRGTVYQKLLDLLGVGDLGIRTARRSPLGGNSNPNQTEYQIYQGNDRSSSVIFSWNSGDLDSTEFLFSNKTQKVICVTYGKWIYGLSDNTKPQPWRGYDLRYSYIDAADIDERYPDANSAWTDNNMRLAMNARGVEALAAQTQVHITRTDISDLTTAQYRRDYDIGDLVTIEDDLNQSAVMRVTEYVEINDENGASGHPTLEIPTGD